MDLSTTIRAVLTDIDLFTRYMSGTRLRAYQKQAALAILDSVIERRGGSFVVIFPRQSGKNELQAHIEAFLLGVLQDRDAEIVKVSPTWKPQSLNAMRRLERVLRDNALTHRRWLRESGYIYRVGRARIYFLSGEPTASIVGATASTLLEVDEAQDVLIDKFDKDIAPMAASTAATRVFWGTAWTSQTLLAREKRLGLDAQAQDGWQRVFQLSADDVRRVVPAYGKFVDAEIAKLGRNHPTVRTQYFSEEIDGQAGLFTAERLALMRGSHAAQAAPDAGRIYAFCIDVGGESSQPGSGGDSREWRSAQPPLPSSEPRTANAEHDATVLTIFEVDLSTLGDPGLQAPTFKAAHRRMWTGTDQPALYAQLNALVNLWNPHRIVIDATGLGEGLAAFLERSHPGQVVRFKFSQSSKSQLGWNFINIVESGRYREHTPDPDLRTPDAELQALFFAQAAACALEILPGPGRMLRYGVPESARHPTSGAALHDDLVLSAMLCAALYDESWGRAESTVIPPADPLDGLSF